MDHLHKRVKQNRAVPNTKKLKIHETISFFEQAVVTNIISNRNYCINFFLNGYKKGSTLYIVLVSLWTR